MGALSHDVVIRPSATANDLLSQLALVECRVAFLGDTHQLGHVLERVPPLGELGECKGEVSLFATTAEFRSHFIRLIGVTGTNFGSHAVTKVDRKLNSIISGVYGLLNI